MRAFDKWAKCTQLNFASTTDAFRWLYVMQKRLNLSDTIYTNSYFEFYSRKLLILCLPYEVIFVAPFISTVQIYIFALKYLALLLRVCSESLNILITSYYKEAINRGTFKHVFFRESKFFKKEYIIHSNVVERYKINTLVFIFYRTHLPQKR